MKLSLSTLINSFLLAASVAVLSSAFSPASAATLQFSIEDFTGDDSTASITLDDMVDPGNVKFTVDITGSPNDGDIRGVFFDINDLGQTFLPNTLTVTGNQVTSFATDNDGMLVRKGGGNQINPGGPFEVAVEIGQPGTSEGIIASTMFTVSSSAGNLTLDNFIGENFGVRLQATTGDEGSSKLQGMAPEKDHGGSDVTVPEPASTAALSLFALSAFGVVKKKAY